MNPERRGLSTVSKGVAVVLVAAVVLVGAYIFSYSTTGSGSTATSTPYNGPLTSLSLFGYFSHMQVKIVQDTSAQPDGGIQAQAITYTVLGREQWNLTQHTKVEFSQPGAGGNVVALFDPSGKIDRLDDLNGGGNHTYLGPGAAYFAQIYTGALDLVTQVSENATLLSMLGQASQNVTTIGSVPLNTTTYTLAAPSDGFKHATLVMASLPATTHRLAVYLDFRTTAALRLTMQITDLAK